MADARFEDGGESPLWLGAASPGDLQVVASLIQDAVFQTGDMTWTRRRREFAVLLNRFRWEDEASVRRGRRKPERVRAMLLIRGVLGIRTQGIDRSDRDLVLSLLDINFTPGTEGSGELILTLAGDGAIAIAVETLDLDLRDVTRPYSALAGRAPDHGL